MGVRTRRTKPEWCAQRPVAAPCRPRQHQLVAKNPGKVGLAVRVGFQALLRHFASADFGL